MKILEIDEEPLHHLKMLVENESSKTLTVICSFGTCLHNTY